MTRITVELLKKRAEHNEKNLTTLEEITLHQFDIEKIELIGDYCKRLKILYLQSNLIPKMENLHKLKELEYLNLALNNIECIEGVHACESLKKLDLTVNFIDCDKLQQSVDNLKQCKNLSDLYLTGNPCTLFDNYRYFVIHNLPQLKRLDGTEIVKSERIKARRNYDSLLQKLQQAANDIMTKKNQRQKNIACGTEKIDVRSHCPEARIQNYIQDKERKEQEEIEEQKKKKFVQPSDPIKEAHAKMNQLAQEGPNGQLPKQRNLMKLAFEINENYGQYGKSLRMIIEAPKFVDTSQMIVDIHPLWMQAQIKSHLLLLHLPCEINVNQSIVRRIVSTGWLELIMPKTNWEISIKTPSSKVFNKHIDIIDTIDNLDCDDTNAISVQDNINTEKYRQGKTAKSNGVVDSGNDKCIKSAWDFDESEVPPLE